MKRTDLLGQNIKKYRERMGLTQGELADKLFVSFQAVSAWERSQSIPDLENIIRISELFSVSVDTLLLRSDEPFLVGIDGGGTKTEFCMFLPDGTVKKRVLSGGSYPNDLGEEMCLRILTEGLEKLLGGARPLFVFAGIAGASVGQWRSILSAALKERLRLDVTVDTDAANVLSLGLDPENTAMIRCGTGSCVFVRKGETMYRMGGWGQLFDEGGSAYDIGKDAVCHTLAVLDGLEEKSLLSEAVERELGCGIWEGLDALYEKGRTYIASLAHIVLETAEKGDDTAEKILKKNADRLGLLIRTAQQRFGAGDAFVRAGSFFQSKRYCALVEEASGCKLVDPGLPPVYGACIEAMRRSGRQIPKDFREKFHESYRRL